MIVQTTFSDIENAARRRTTKRDAFLREMDEAVPWEALVALVKPCYYKGERGRRPVGVERMLRMYFLQLWFNLSDEGVEDAVYDSRAFSEFMGVRFGAGDQVPDATTLLKFRRVLEGNGLGARILERVNEVLEEKGVMMRGGSIVDATFVEAPSSTKNASRSRDPETRQARKGNNWHFGCKAHVGVDAGSGLARAVEVTPANVCDVTVAHALVREDDSFCYADAGYVGVEKRPGQVKEAREGSLEREIERRKASVRSKVEHPFLIVKRQFGFARTRYRGLAKTANALNVLFALANVAMWSRAGRPELPAGSPA